MWQLIREGGYIMYPLALMSVFAMAIILDRLFYFRQAKIRANDLLPKLKDALTKQDLERVIALCKSVPGEISSVLLKGLRNFDELKEKVSVEALEERVSKLVVQSSVELRHALEQFLTFLLMLGILAPLTGFMGTFGGIKSALGEMAVDWTEMNAILKQISGCITPSVAGCCLGIIIILFWIYFALSARKMSMLLDEFTGDFVRAVEKKLYFDTASKKEKK